MKQRRLLLGLIALIAAGAVFFLPPVYWRAVGWWKGEAFYQGRPTSYWAAEARRLTPMVWIASGNFHRFRTWCLWGRRASSLDELLERVGLVRFSVQYNEFELLRGETAGIPVLVEMLRNPDAQVRTIAAQGLEEVASKEGDISPSLDELCRALRDEEEDVRQQARQALWMASPDFKE